jgi:NAD(P)-dependent dehydrogenase (short-subunit alcohol dehydrogenase family)
MNSNQRLAGKIVLITGGTSGLGLATAKRFVDEGAYVFITGRRQAELDSAVKKIGKHTTGIQGDVSKKADLDRWCDVIKKEKGHLDIVFVNAGIGSFSPLAVATEEHIDGMLAVNFKGVIFTVQKTLPLLKDGGTFILNASSAATKGMAAFGVYAATKAAIRSFARTLATELKDRRIRVNAISPGVIPTEGYHVNLGMSEEQVKGFSAMMSQQIPLGRVGVPDEVAKAVLFLASDDSSYVSGFELVVDGGMNQV